MKISYLALAIVAMAGLSTTTVRADGREATQARVSLKGMDLSEPSDVTTLYRKLDKAARDVCDSETTMSRTIVSQDRACARQSLDEAVREVNDERLNNLHARRSGAQTQAQTEATAVAAR